MNNIRSAISPPAYNAPAFPRYSAVLSKFEPVSLDHIIDIVTHTEPPSCPLDILSPCLLKEVFDTVGPTILCILNSSLETGSVPSSLKHAIVHPIIKKPNLDSTILDNFRPISKLQFLSKVLEKIVYSQLLSFLENNNMIEKFQSGFRACHSTEPALLKVSNDLLLSLDSGKCAILILLDLSSTFDTVDHTILLHRLEHQVSIQGSTLQWFASYLADFSSSAPITCGVPQGSILGPISFTLYMLPLHSIFNKYNISYHCYADDTQLYLPLEPGDNNDNAVRSLLDCILDIQNWMAQNYLQTNASKTEVVLFGPSNSSGGIANLLGPLAPYLHSHARNLGVIFDSALKFDKQINSVVKGCFFHLRNIAKLKPLLSFNDLKTVTNTLISSGLDYCNALYLGASHPCLACN